MKKITNELIQIFKNHLINEEKAIATVEKYIHDVFKFMLWLSGAEVTKSLVLQYKSELEENYAQTSVNTILAALNSFFVFNEWYDCKVKSLKIQRNIFANKDKELSVEEYDRLLAVAKKKSNQKTLRKKDKVYVIIVLAYLPIGSSILECTHLYAMLHRRYLACFLCQSSVKA